MENTNKADLVMAADGRQAAEKAGDLLAQAIEQCDGCMDETQVEPEDAAAWKVVRAALTAEKRKTLELQRVYDERGLQIGRLETALERARPAAADAVVQSDGCAACIGTYCLSGEVCRSCGHVAESQGVKTDSPTANGAYARAALATPASPASAPEASDEQVNEGVRAFVAAGKRGCDLIGAIRCVIEGAILAAPLPPVVARKDGEDSKRLDWLETKVVNVRDQLRYGSRDMFWASPSDDDGDTGPSDIRAQIDAARLAGKAEGSDAA